MENSQPDRRWTRELLERRREALEAYERWEAERSPDLVSDDLFARLDSLRSLLPEAVRRPIADHDYAGVRQAHLALAVLGRRG